MFPSDASTHSVPYSCTVADGALTIVILPEFDLTTLYQDWTRDLLASQPGPWREVRIDLSRRGPMPSIFFAGLLQLHATWTRGGAAALVLHHPDPNVIQGLERMRLAQLFRIEARTAPTDDERDLIGGRSFIHPSIASLAGRITALGDADDPVTRDALRRACVRKLRKYRQKDYLAGFAEGTVRTEALRLWEMVDAFARQRTLTTP